ncbi:MAG: pilus assembly protein [Chloroflexi bacterium]|nr:pilus assembly protein [Chloroflexota bacterium]
MKNRRSERGQSVVELAISFVVLVMLLAVTVDGGRLFFSYIAVREAAQEGAQYGSIHPTLADFDDIEARVRDSSNSPVDLTDTSLVTVTPVLVGTDYCADGTNAIQVTVSYTFKLTMPFVSSMIGTNQFDIVLDATSNILRPQC